jgi:hypothetical protein
MALFCAFLIVATTVTVPPTSVFATTPDETEGGGLSASEGAGIASAEADGALAIAPALEPAEVTPPLTDAPIETDAAAAPTTALEPVEPILPLTDVPIDAPVEALIDVLEPDAQEEARANVADLQGEGSFAPLDGDPPAPATVATLSFTAQTTSDGPVSTTDDQPKVGLSAKVGDMVTIKATITANGAAYGFTAGFPYNSDYLQLDTTTWEADNPGFSAPAIIGWQAVRQIRVNANSDGETLFLSQDNPSRTITFKFKAIRPSSTGAYMSFDAGTMLNRAALLTDSTLRIEEMTYNGSITGNFIGGNSIPARVKAGTLVLQDNPTDRVDINITALANASITFDAAENPLKGHIGETVAFTLTISSDVDAYGFGVVLNFETLSSGLGDNLQVLEVDTDRFAQDNHGLICEVRGGNRWVYRESDGSTVAIKANKPLNVTVRAKVLHETGIGSSLGGASLNAAIPAFLILDPTVRITGEGGLAPLGNERANVVAAELAGTVLVASSPDVLEIVPAYHVSAVIESGVPGFVGTGTQQPITVPMTINAPADKDVYGFEVALNPAAASYASVVLDNALTKAANPGLSLNTVYGTASIGTNYLQVYIESDGVTPVIKKGGTLTINLVYLPVLTKGPATVTVGVEAMSATHLFLSYCRHRLVLLTDPLVRVQAGGEGLTTVNFDRANILAAETAGKIVVAEVTNGSIVLKAKIEGLTLDSSGRYQITTATDLQAFADAVNGGENRIHGYITKAIDASTLDSFEGIGTIEHPYRGTLAGYSSSTAKVTISRSVTGGSDVAVGGLVNYLGSGGVVNYCTILGTLDVSGVTGTASVGGAVGRSDGGTMNGVINNATITATGVNSSVGGAVGTAASASLGNCRNTGQIVGGTNAGGIVGSSTNSGISASTNAAAVTGSVNAGGIVGVATGGTVSTSGNGVYVSAIKSRSGGGSITGNTSAGGVAGTASGVAFNNCYNTGAVQGGIQAGGIVGNLAGGSVTESWSSADGTVASSVASAAVGGIIGRVSAEGSAVRFNSNLAAVSAGGAGASAGGVLGAYSVAPQEYKGNYYLMGSALGDAFGALFTSLEHLALTGATSSVPGKYVYQADSPEKDGDGVYLLQTADDVMWFATTVNTNTAQTADVDGNEISGRLVNDLDLSDTQFSGIGMPTPDTARYIGTFDGGGHTVTVKLSSGAFFSYCGNGVVIKNLTVAGSVTGSAGVVAAIQGGSIIDCVNEATVTGAAGIVAQAVPFPADTATITISGCVNNGAINAAGGSIGGIVATLRGNTLVTDCTNNGVISGAGQYTGGIAGLVEVGVTRDVKITGCHNTADVSTTAPPSPSIVNYDSIGGIVGSVKGLDVASGNLAELIIDSCTNSGDISGTVVRLGGICGAAQNSGYSSDLKIINCVNTGDVTNLYDGDDPFIIAYIRAGGILGRTDNLYTVDGSGVSHTHEVVTGNTNHGNVSSLKGGTLSSIVAGKEGTITGNSSSVLVGNDANDPNITYTGSNPDPGPNPDPDPDPDPNSPGDPDLPSNPDTPNPGNNPGITPGPSSPTGPTVPLLPIFPSPSVADSTTAVTAAPQTTPEQTPAPALATPTEPQPQQTQPEPETPLSDTTTATEVVLTPVPLGLGFQTVANTVLTLAVGFIALGVFILGGFIFWRMYKRRIDQ